jgi:hypothetical protein
MTARESATDRYARLHPPTPELTITIEGRDRYWVADALYQAVREHEEGARKLGKQSRARMMLSSTADRLRAYADRLVP